MLDRSVSDGSQFETPFNALNTVGKSVDTVRYFCQADRELRYFGFQRANTLLHLTHIVAQSVDNAADMAQVFQHDAFCLGHGDLIAQNRYRENFLYFNRCGMMLSCPSRRILSAS